MHCRKTASFTLLPRGGNCSCGFGITFAFPSVQSKRKAAVLLQDKEQLVQSRDFMLPLAIISTFNKEFSCLKIRLVSISHVQQKTFLVAVQWHTFTTGEIIREESEIMMRSFCRRNLKGGKSSLCIQKWFAFLLQLKTFAWPPFKRRKQRFSLTTFCTGRPNSWLSEMSLKLMKWFLPYP